MKKCSLFLVFTFCIVCAATSQTAPSVPELGIITPGPPYPQAALTAKVSGSGSCSVYFDASGHVDDATMMRSTGSKILDENTVDYARKNWTGRPYRRFIVQLTYRLDNPSKRAEIIVWIMVPPPPYPYQAVANKEQGSGTVEVSFDESGNAVNATMTKSTGIDILDKNTVSFIMYAWKSSGGKKTTISLPMTYRLP